MPQAQRAERGDGIGALLNSPNAEEFFDLARYGLMLAEQTADDAARESLLKLLRAWVAAVRQVTQLVGRDECAS